jgi:preprotein translocase subunit SecE
VQQRLASVPDGNRVRTSSLSQEICMKEKIIAFFTDVVKEMNKVTWPKKDDLRDSTVVVLVVCILISAFVYLVDTVVSTILRQIL